MNNDRDLWQPHRDVVIGTLIGVGVSVAALLMVWLVRVIV